MRHAFRAAASRAWGSQRQRTARSISAAASVPKAAPPAAPAAGEVLELSCSELAFGGEVSWAAAVSSWSSRPYHALPHQFLTLPLLSLPLLCQGLCKLPGGFVVFVPGALPGELLTARVTQSKRSFARAAKLETLRPHAAAADPACRHFGPCGGCSLQALQYAAQVEAKHRQVIDLLTRVARVADPEGLVRPIIPCAQPYAYRNKMEFSFSSARAAPGGGGGGGGGAGLPFVLGLHRPGSQHDILPIDACSLQSAAADEILALAARLCAEAGLLACGGGRAGAAGFSSSGKAILQHLVIRRAGAAPSRDPGATLAADGGLLPEDEYLVNFVTSRDARRELAPVASALAAGCAARVAGVVNTVSAAGRPAGERRVAGEHVLHGRGRLVERLAGLTFEISPNSFFQVNTPQAELLYALVARAADLRPEDTVLDLYCGAGTMTLMLARACRQAWGVEVVPSAVDDAERNARRNGVPNARFLRGRAEGLLGALPTADVVVADPARSGLAPAVVEYLRGCEARRVVYVSCNPATQARDIAALCAPGGPGAALRLAWAQAVDLYPQTPHVETVAVLER
jgi:tRNA/tmRNA/rRNA uracil-C5-methylase (TrmA/RlmC/RlmD family)